MLEIMKNKAYMKLNGQSELNDSKAQYVLV